MCTIVYKFPILKEQFISCIYFDMSVQFTDYHKRCGQEDAIPLGWHRNAHENTLGTLFATGCLNIVEMQDEII